MTQFEHPVRRVKTKEEQMRSRLKRQLALSRFGLLCERFTQAFWPVWSVLLTGCGALMLGLQDHISLLMLQIVVSLGTFALLYFLIVGTRKFQIPTLEEARAQLDKNMPGQPLAALADRQILGAEDIASRAVWRAHQARMQEAVQNARASSPDLKISHLDRYGLRYIALLIFAMAALFGTPWRVADITTVAQGRPVAINTGPSWEGWIDPPSYTGLPTLYLNDQPPGALNVVEGSEFFLRLYSDSGQLDIRQTIADMPITPDSALLEHRLTATQNGTLQIDGVGGAEWQITVTPDMPPSVIVTEDIEVTLSGEMRQAFHAADDYGVVSGSAHISLDLQAVDRRHGLGVAPEPRAPITLDLPLTISGDRRSFDDVLVENLSQHPWSGLPVILELSVTDGASQTGRSTPISLTLPGRRFFDMTARAIIEQRRDLLWSRDNSKRVAQLLRATSHRPDALFNHASHYLMLRKALRHLETVLMAGLTDTEQNDLADIFWHIALQIEDGDISDAMERMRQAQDRLMQAMRDGASDEEIAELMQELRDAVRDYMRQLAENPESTSDQPNFGDMQMLSQQDLQEMMNRIQELMEQGRMAEAEALMKQFQQMMENLRMADQPGQSGQGQGQQSMEDLSKTLRDQQGLSDEAFRQLQEQFNSGAMAGQSQGNTGRSGSEGRGQSHDGQGRGNGADDGSGRDGAQRGQDPFDGSGQSLAQRQQALRDELLRQEQGLPGAGTPEGDAARDALDRAGRAMDGAEQALREEDFAGALDNQAQALDALREGIRNLSEALSQGQNQAGSQNGEGQASTNSNDPLGRETGGNGATNGSSELGNRENVHKRALELLGKLRERSTDQERSKKELEYLRRLLDRF